MPTDLQRDEVRRLLERGAQLVDVLPARQYEKEHLPGAISLPLDRLNRETAQQLTRHRPVIVYCFDLQ